MQHKKVNINSKVAGNYGSLSADTAATILKQLPFTDPRYHEVQTNARPSRIIGPELFTVKTAGG